MLLRGFRPALVVCCLVIAVYSAGNGLYISLKAELAQWLIAEGWQAGHGSKPWPWADTWPVARMQLAGEEMYVLAGSHGSALAFGPGHVDGTVLPGEPGVSVIGGHRDTHFEVLEDIEPGDVITVQTADQRWHEYVVDHREVVDTRVVTSIELAADTARLVLVTCYPFDALVAGGPLRYVVEAHKKEPVR